MKKIEGHKKGIFLAIFAKSSKNPDPPEKKVDFLRFCENRKNSFLRAAPFLQKTRFLMKTHWYPSGFFAKVNNFDENALYRTQNPPLGGFWAV